jgi:hypothetical protein
VYADNPYHFYDMDWSVTAYASGSNTIPSLPQIIQINKEHGLERGRGAANKPMRKYIIKTGILRFVRPHSLVHGHPKF